MKSEIERLRSEVADKSSQLDSVKTELCEKATGLKNTKLENSRLEEQLNESNQQEKTLEEQQHMSAVLIDEQKAYITATNEEKLRLERMICEYKEKSELLTAENRELEKSLETLDTQHQDVIQQLMVSRDNLTTNSQDLNLRIATHSKATDKPETDSNRVSYMEPEPAETLSSGNSSLLSENAKALVLDAANRVEEEACEQLECDLVLSHAKTEQSSDTDGQALKACRAELQHLQLIMTERQKSYSDQIAQLSAELETCQSARNVECSDCSSKDCLISELKVRTQLLTDDGQQHVRDLDSCRGQFEDEKKKYEADIAQLRQQVEELTAKLLHVDDQPAAYPVSDSQVDDVATLRTEIESLKEKLDEKESVCKLYESEVERLSEIEDRLTKEIERQQDPQIDISSLSTDDEIRTLRDQLSLRECELKEMKEENSSLQCKLDEMSAEMERMQQKLQESTAGGSGRPSSNCEVQTLETGIATVVENSVEISRAEAPNDGGDIPHESREIIQLRSTVSQQKNMLDALNSKYASLRGLLEDRSQAQHGSSVLSDHHQLELDLREVRADRERLLAVLGEKTREASALRAEVHRLTSVAMASQAALSKAQHDARQIATQSHRETNQDMKNEAVKKLSQLIKDKDMEIDALQLKNATLVQV